jgi:HD-like signal output (HDOD) protein
VLHHYRDNRPKLAPAPSLSLQIVGLAIRPDAGAAELVPLINNDPALATSLLRVANSAHYRAARDIETVRDAVVRLGIVEASRLASALAAKTLFNPQLKHERSTFGRRFTDEFQRAMTIAAVSATLAMKTPRAHSDRAYLGGILVDASRSVALRSLHALMADAVVAFNVDEAQLERVLELAHVDIGREAQQHWNLPSYLGDICALAHEEGLPAAPELTDVHVVRLVSALEDLRRGAARWPRATSEVLEGARALRVTPQAARALLTDLRTNRERAARTFTAAA